MPAVATLRGWSPFTALQIPYNVASREPERELLPMAQALGLALTPWGVLEAGILTGKPASERRWPEETVSDTAGRVLTVLQELGEEREATTAQVAIAWLLRRHAGLTIVPIIAARRQEQIVDNLGALDVDLDADDMARLDAAGRPQLGFPRGFLESSNVRGLIYGNTFEKLRA
jgi:aryl-alcohol dehydrogenase-like predicted oxidoreductase